MTFIKRIDRKVRRSDSRPIQRDTDLVNDVVTQMMGTESAWLKTPSRLGMPGKKMAMERFACRCAEPV